MDNSLNIVLPPQFVVNIVQVTGGTAGFSVLAGVTAFNVTISTSGRASNGAIGEEFTLAEKVKLAAIEPLATIDQTGEEIKTAYELEINTNAFTDGEKTKLAGIMAGATDDLTGAEIKVLYENEAQTNAYDDAAVSKLAGIDTGAKDDQTPAEIRTAVAAATDSNVFQDADASKLDGIEDGATTDQTDSQIETAYNAQVAQVSAGEMTGGTEAEVRRFSPDDVENMIVIHAPGSMSDSEVKTAYENNADTNAFTDALEDHYGLPLADIAALVALAEASLTDMERRFVEGEIADYFYDAQASSGDEAPTDQTGGTGFWLKIVASGETATSIKTKYESNDDTNAHTDAQVSKLAGIDTGAKDDQTGAEIKSAYEGETNAYTDIKNTKLTTIENSADVTDAGNVAAAGAIMDDDISEGEGFLRKTGAGAYVAVKTNLAAAVAPGVTDDSASDYGIGSRWIDTTADKEYVCLDAGVGVAVWTETTGGGSAMSDAEIKTAYENNANTNEFDDDEQNKLAGIENSATADQTNAEIRTAVEAATDSNVFTDADHSKLDAIGADTDFYDLGMDFLGKPTDAQIIARWVVLREVTMPADFSGAGGSILTNPTGALAIDIKDDGTTIGTVSISTSGVFTFTTVTGTEKVVAAGSIVTATGPSTADATGSDIVFTLPGAL